MLTEINSQEIYVNNFLTDSMAATLFYELKDGNISSILDLCSGNGNVVIWALEKIEDVNSINKITLSDINAKACSIAKLNVNKNIANILKSKTTVIQSDLFNNIPEYKYDIITALTPCFDELEYNLMLMMYKDISLLLPKEAFVASKNDRYYLIKKILENYNNFLSKNGKIILYAVDDEAINWYKNNVSLYNLKINKINKTIDSTNQTRMFVILERINNEDFI